MSEPDSLSAAPSLPQIGSYRLLESLGSGGMSSVFKAVHVESGHEVAVKVLPRSLAKNPTLLQRFLREARSAEALEHPNIVGIFDRGSEAGRYYLVLELVVGGDLHDRVRDRGAFPVGEAVRVLKEVTLALKYAAGKGVIHRDIKPANILLGDDGRVKLTDLGLALQAEDEDERVTRDGTTVGTVDYMAPEQARDSRATSLKSDIYSLGCTAHYILTGKPPFVGGDLADKLRRHVLEPAPDVRAIRPDVPEPLARLIRKMMAKKPEARPASYDDLLAALDRIAEASATAGEAGLVALIDDEEAPPVALIDDEDEAPATTADYSVGAAGLLAMDSAPPTVEGLQARRDRINRESSRKDRSEVSLSELAGLDEDDEPRSARRKKPSSAAIVPTLPGTPASAFEDEGEELLSGVAVPLRSSGASDDSVKTYILRGLIFGVVIVLIGVGIQQLVAFSRPEPPEVVATEEESPTSTSKPEPPAPEDVTPAPKPIRKPASAVKSAAPKATPVAVWSEPKESGPDRSDEPKVAASAEARFLPDWGLGVVPTRLEGPFVTVRRLESGRDPARASSLSKALDQAGGTVEIADDGPFFEKDLRAGSKSRLIRARPGFHPIVVIEAPTSGIARQQGAVFDLGSTKLILDGLDIVVKARDFPRELSTLFLVRSGELTLRDCSITVDGPADRVFSLIKVGTAASGATPPRVILQRTSVRGPSLRAFEFAGGSAEVVVDRSVLLCGGAPAIASEGDAIARSRRVSILRSILASQGPLLDLGGPGVSIRSLATTLAHIEGRDSAALIEVREATSAPARDVVDWDWSGVDFEGWSHWMTAGTGRSVKVADLAAARVVWPRSDAESQSRATGWPDSILAEDRPTQGLARFATDRRPTIDRVALPSPFLWAKALESFPRQKIPEPAQPKGASGPSAAPPTPPAAPQPKAKRAAVPSPFAATPNAVHVGPNLPPNLLRPEAPKPPPRVQASSGSSEFVDLEFDTTDPNWRGDLGLFVRVSAPRGARVIRVRATGQGSHRSTSIHLEPGVSLELTVVPGPPGTAPLSWVAGADDPWIGVRSADLTLTGVEVSGDPGGRTKALVRVEDGLLTIRKSRLNAPWPTPGALISIRGTGTRPLAARPGEPGPRPDRPVARISDSVLQTGGVAVSADLARGVVALENSIVNAGSAAFDLRPQGVRRDRFEADLWIDRSTIASERDVVRLGPWPGEAPGPDRPWLISSRASAFLDAYDRPIQGDVSVLLRADPEAMGRGAIVWESADDVYDWTHFAVLGDDPPPENSRPDLARQWIDLWGRNHVMRASGPGLNGSKPRVRPVVGRLKLRGVRPGDLALEAARAADARKPLNVGADLRTIGITPSPSIGQRPR